ncbi:DNA-processing protein DprA [Bermanella sp. WJH001]|uniref:DNA-processing protein DprA n=1 Tax=Bermanella sp. WJH001 TaxID=3048005 RepID=UPI0024BE8B92|nr:DNA-processing protein DprA [Bermanella sp. WJH001]MDJ1538846.1 DNA-processing protein DprA [Bermanella sp. WJH001]
MDWTTQQLAWISLALVPGVGPKTFQKIIAADIELSEIFNFEIEQLKSLGMSDKSATHVLKHPPNKPSKQVESALKWAQSPQHHLLTLDCQDYPEHLKQIATAPPLLMVKGNKAALNFPQVAMVGSRYPTHSGAQQAYDFAQQLANLGVTITSGLARGVDALAHQGVVDLGGTTIAVLGTGIDNIYPKANIKLAEQISEKGALVSEFALGANAMKGHFPRRNRIVSGLSLATLVVEATLKSGSLITARQALEQNRDVMAIPGSIQNPQKAGCHFLIRQGASLIETPEQVLQELSLQLTPRNEAGAHKLNCAQNNDAQLDLQGEQLKVYAALDYDGTDMESLVNKTQLDVGQLSMVLMELELAGILTHEQGVYARI